MLTAVAELTLDPQRSPYGNPEAPCTLLSPPPRASTGLLTLLLQFLKLPDTEEKLFSLTHLKRASGLSALRPRLGHDRDLHTINFCEFYSPQWSDIKQAQGGATVTGVFLRSPALGYGREGR